MRMSSKQPTHRIHNMRISGFKTKGRPRKSWTNYVKESLLKHSITLEQDIHLAAEKTLSSCDTPKGTSRLRERERKTAAGAG